MRPIRCFCYTWRNWVKLTSGKYIHDCDERVQFYQKHDFDINDYANDIIYDTTKAICYHCGDIQEYKDLDEYCPKYPEKIVI